MVLATDTNEGGGRVGGALQVLVHRRHAIIYVFMQKSRQVHLCRLFVALIREEKTRVSASPCSFHPTVFIPRLCLHTQFPGGFQTGFILA